MGKNGVKVIIRTRPTASFAGSQILIDQDDHIVTIRSQPGFLDSPQQEPQAGPGYGSPSKHESHHRQPNVSSNKKDCWTFKFHQVLHNAGQDRVYEAIARDIVHGAVVGGVNGTILAYGQTGAGKSFTMIGDTRNYAHRGIAPRAIAQIFEEVENRIELRYHIQVSYMEIYNDRIYDLLTPTTSATKQSNDVYNHSGNSDYVVVEDCKGTYVRGLTMVNVTNEQDALDQLFYGELQRTTAEHQLNKRSNRSHCIFTVHIAQKSRVGGTERVTYSKLHLVDLAGSERLKKTMDDDSLAKSTTSISTIKKESMYINQSLSFLEQCIVALSSKDYRHVPYRQTKLTNVLKDSLGGNSNTLMFACIWGESKHLEETISTLKLAQRMMRVQNHTASIVESDPILLLKKYEKQIKDLKHELVMHDALVERTSIIYDEHTPEQKLLLMNQVRKYLDATTQENEDEALQLTSVNQIRELFRQFKILFKSECLRRENSSQSERLSRGGSAASHVSQHKLGGDNESCSINDRDKSYHHDTPVGDDNPNAKGFGLGLVSNNARPITLDIMNSKSHKINSNAQSVSHPPVNAESKGNHIPKAIRTNCEVNQLPSEYVSIDDDPQTENGSPPKNEQVGSPFEEARQLTLKNEAFKIFKSKKGKELCKSLDDEKDKLVNCKQAIKSATRKVNEAKELIDSARLKLADKRAIQINVQKHVKPSMPKSNFSDRGSEEVVDEEEFLLMTAERDAKRDYRAFYDELKEAKEELEYYTRSVELLRMQLVREFDEWFDADGHTLATNVQQSRNVGQLQIRAYSKEDKMDDGEKFDLMELERIRAQDPDSLAFFQAQKKMRQAESASKSNQIKRSKRRV